MASYAKEDEAFSHSPSLSLDSSSSSERSQPVRVHQQVRRQGRERSTSIYIGGLQSDIKREDLKKNFKKFGIIKKIWVAHKPPGFAFIEFSNHQDAHFAIREMNGAVIKGCKIRVELSHKDQMRGGGGGGGPIYCKGRGFRSGRGHRPYYSGGGIHHRSDSRYGSGGGGGGGDCRKYGGGGGGGGFRSRRPYRQ